MMTMYEVAQAVQGVHVGSNSYINAVSTDSRTIAPGSLFVALEGERFDGHEYVKQAETAGALGALVSREVDADIPQTIVADTADALLRLAGWWRRQFEIALTAVTGSNGKTTVKEMIGSILKSAASTLISKGNFNNQIGLPLSLLEIRQEHGFAAVEIGMNQIGEIESLSSLAMPNVAVITNAGAAHLEHLHSVSQVAVEKGRIIASLPEHGTAVLNRDDQHFEYWQELAKNCEIISFGFSDKADVQAQYLPTETEVKTCLKTPIGSIDANMQLVGRHNSANAAAAAAAAIALEIESEHIKTGLEFVRPVRGRLQMRVHRMGGKLYDDTYNANPNSVKAAIEFLSEIKGDRRLIIGDMFELGSDSEQFHREVGRRAREAGVGRLYGLGELSAYAVMEFGHGARCYLQREELTSDVLGDLSATTVLLVKGSRGMKMELVADEICAAKSSFLGEGSC